MKCIWATVSAHCLLVLTQGVHETACAQEVMSDVRDAWSVPCGLPQAAVQLISVVTWQLPVV